MTDDDGQELNLRADRIMARMRRDLETEDLETAARDAMRVATACLIVSGISFAVGVGLLIFRFNSPENAQRGGGLVVTLAIAVLALGLWRRSVALGLYAEVKRRRDE